MLGPKGLCEQGSTKKQKVAVDLNVCLRFYNETERSDFQETMSPTS